MGRRASQGVKIGRISAGKGAVLRVRLAQQRSRTAWSGKGAVTALGGARRDASRRNGDTGAAATPAQRRRESPRGAVPAQATSANSIAPAWRFKHADAETDAGAPALEGLPFAVCSCSPVCFSGTNAIASRWNVAASAEAAAAERFPRRGFAPRWLWRSDSDASCPASPRAAAGRLVVSQRLDARRGEVAQGLVHQARQHFVVAGFRRADLVRQGDFVARIDKQMQLEAEPLHDPADLSVLAGVFLAAACRSACSFCSRASARVRRALSQVESPAVCCPRSGTARPRRWTITRKTSWRSDRWGSCPNVSRKRETFQP
jgi:hypothetical protein